MSDRDDVIRPEPLEPPVGPAGPAASATLPPPPGPQPRRTRTGLIVAIVAAVLVVVVVLVGIGLFAAARTRGDTSSAAGASGATDTSGLPPSIGGSPLLEGDIADAFKNLMDAYSGEGVASTGLYGSEARPEYMYILFDTDIPPTVSGETVLRESAQAAGYPIKGGYVQGDDGPTHITCAPFGSPGVSAMCFVAADRPGLAIAFHASPDDALQDLLAADT